jgi:HPt (histidine-containing phosphotransfer) domain-containing protein
LSKPIDSRELNLILIDFIRNRRTGDAAEAYPRPSEEQNTKADGSELKALVKKDIENAIGILQNNTLSDSEIDLFVTTVHGLKGALLNINEKELSQNAFKLESAGRQRDYELLKRETPEFLKILKELTAKL